MKPSLGNKGFTLIELMVVVAIIGILMAAGILAFGSAQQGARDARRRTDINAFVKANEQYYSTNNYLYAATPSALTTYFPSGAVPVDPKGTAYTYTTDAGKTTYCVCALLEQVGKGSNTTAGSAGACVYGAGNYFCGDSRQ
jgi:prepilin-type N-terminal cleavage/methylation domain-containing protein